MQLTALGMERLQYPPFDLYATIKQYLSPFSSLVAILEQSLVKIVLFLPVSSIWTCCCHATTVSLSYSSLLLWVIRNITAHFSESSKLWAPSLFIHSSFNSLASLVSQSLIHRNVSNRQHIRVLTVPVIVASFIPMLCCGHRSSKQIRNCALETLPM